jgi:hypothetical protein
MIGSRSVFLLPSSFLLLSSFSLFVAPYLECASHWDETRDDRRVR